MERLQRAGVLEELIRQFHLREAKRFFDFSASFPAEKVKKKTKKTNSKPEATSSVNYDRGAEFDDRLYTWRRGFMDF